MADTPTNLGPKALQLWTDIASAYSLRPDELRVLEDACREVDLVERLAEELRTSELVVKGSMGQPAAHPLEAALVRHRGVLQRLLVGLKLPDQPGGTVNHRSVSAREAALTRWNRGTKAK